MAVPSGYKYGELSAPIGKLVAMPVDTTGTQR